MTKPCPSCGSAVDQMAATCPTCAWSFTGAQAGTAMQLMSAPVKRPKIPVEVDLVVDIDITGSSAPFAEGIRGNLGILLDKIEEKAKGVRVWLLTHGDEDFGQQPTIITAGAGRDEAVEAVKRLFFDGGGDEAEHHLNALHFILQSIPFTSDPRRSRGAIISFTTASSKPVTGGRTPRDIGAEIAGRNLIACFVAEPYDDLNEVVEASGAFLFPISATPSPADMQTVAGQVAASIVASIRTTGTVTAAVSPAQ